MEGPSVVNQVFDGAGALVNGGKAIANAAFTTMDMINNIGQNLNQPQQQMMYSRRDSGYQLPQQSVPYQPSTYPWAHQVYGGYGFTQQGYQNGPGYPGISNPNYGRNGFYGQSMFTTGTSNFENRPIGSNWMDRGIWG